MRNFFINLLFGLFVFAPVILTAQESKGLLSLQSSIQSSSDNKSGTNSARFELSQNSPNPFSDFTAIEYMCPVLGFVEFKIVNLIGKEVFHKVLEAEAGRNILRFECDDFVPGVYIYSLSNGSQTITRRMVISKK